MNLTGESVLLTVIVSQDDKIKGKPVYEEIVRTAHEKNIAGATVTHGIMGYGGTSRISSAKIMRLSENLPVTIQIVDEKEKIDLFMPYIDSIIKEGIVFTSKVDVAIYRYSKG